ncbi:PCMD domain-containing protein [Parabacteroides chinchillae]|nr:PCMD domain-containing protein [Parabacteroides chinchillae]
MKRYIGVLLFLLVFFPSCEEKDNLIEEGYLYVSTTKDLDVITRSEADVEPVSVAICKAATGDTVKFFENYDKDLGAKGKVQLPVGLYHVKAGTKYAGKAAFDKPYYFGVDTIEVVKATMKEAEVVCTLANVKVTVKYSDLLKKFFTGYKVTVGNASGELIFDEEEVRAGYFTPSKLNVTLNLVNNDGTAYKIVKELPNVKAREHYRLNFSIGEEPDSPEAGGDFDITVDEETNDIECTLKIPVFEDDFGRNMPKIVTTPDGELNIKETNPANTQLSSAITSKNGLQLLALKLVSTYFNETEGLPAYIDLMKMDDNVRSRLSGLGISIPQLAEAAIETNLDFSGLLSKLPLKDGKKTSHSITVIARDKLGQQVEDTVLIEVRPNVAVETTVGVWSTFVYLSATAGTNENIAVYYKKQDDESWMMAPLTPSDIKETADGDYIFSVKIKDLIKNTAYSYKVIADRDEQEGSFQTGDEAQIPYSNFDSWYTKSKAQYVGTESNHLWDSGNEGGASFGFVPTTEETTDVIKGSAAKLASTYAVVKFAAGNLYTGDFVELYQTTQARLDFGIPYSCKPTALKGYYKYSPGTIDKGSYLNLNGTVDSCHIYIALCDWTKPFRVETGSQTFVDLSVDNKSIIAFGELKTNKKMEKYEQFRIDLEYRDKYRQPTYILVVASASKYGDYFTGSTSSVLLIDEFELLFDDPQDKIK